MSGSHGMYTIVVLQNHATKNNLVKRIRDKLKIFFIKLFARTIRGLGKLKHGLQPLGKILEKPLTGLGRFLLLLLVLPLYKTYSSIKKVTARFYAPHKIRHKIIHPFSRRYLTHFIIIAIAFFTIASNLNAYETRQEDFGRISIAATIASDQDLGAIAEEGPVQSEAGRSLRYQQPSGIGVQPQVIEGPSEPEVLPPTVAGGSAVTKPIISPAVPSSGPRTEIIYYTVQDGDTVSTIANQFGITINTILWANNLSSSKLIRPGDKLMILPTSGVQHQVAKGETLAKIAKKYAVDPDTILEFNRIASADEIHSGETLIIPGGKKIVIPVVTRPVYQPRPTYEPTPEPTTVASTGQMTWPVGCRRITQYFSWRHTGVDIACGMGVPVYAADNGRVIKAQGGYNGGYGLMIIIDHGNGLQTLYGHLSKLFVEEGEIVSRGQQIAAQGSTGHSTGPHTHFEVRSGGVRRNPLLYIR